MKKVLCIFLLCMEFFSCQEGRDTKNEIPVLDIDYEVVPDLSKVEEMQKNMQVRFVPLEAKGDESYFKVKSSMVFDNGRMIFVIDQNKDRILLFGQNGKFLDIINRKGEGPEEYISLHDFCITNDLIYVLDINRKIQIYDFNGNFQKTIPLQDGGNQIYVTEDGRIFVGRYFNSETYWLVYDNQGNIVEKLFPTNEKLHKFDIPKGSTKTIGSYDGGIYVSNYLDYNIYLLKDSANVLAKVDFGNLNIPNDFFEGSTDVVEKRFWNLRGKVGSIKAILSIENLLVTDDWIVFLPGELASRGIYYNRKTGFYMTTKYFTEPYKKFLTGYNTPDGYNPETGEFYRLVNAMDLKATIEEMAAKDKDYLEKYPFFKNINPEEIDDNTNEWVMFFKL